MLKPNFYKQIDPRWSKYSYPVSGGRPTIGGSGCGPSSCANVLSATTRPKWTPKTTFKWACKHGYMTAYQGMYWTGIKAILKHGGITNVKQTGSADKALSALKKGYWVIGLVGPSRWTRGGHYILLYGYKNGTVYISDPYSYSNYQQRAPWSAYAAADKQEWLIINPKQYKKRKNKGSKKALLYVDKKVVTIRQKPNLKAKKMGQVKFNTAMTLQPVNKNWYKIVKGKYKGYYIHKGNFSKYKQNVQKYKTLTNMNVRDGYTTKADVIGGVSKGVTLKSTKQRGRWAYFPKQKGLNKPGFICIKSSDGKDNYLKKV